MVPEGEPAAGGQRKASSVSLRDVLRWGSLVFAVLVLLSIFVYVAFRLGAAPNYLSVTDVGEFKREAVNLRLDTAQRYFDLALLLLALLWGLIILEREKVRLTRADMPEIWMFIIANVLLVSSMVTHLLYKGRIESLYWDTVGNNFPDLFGEHVSSLYYSQQFFLGGSIIVGVLTVVSNTVFKER